ncbi:MAG: hypothetical protein RIC15_06400 [Vicingaceae bacterium]
MRFSGKNLAVNSLLCSIGLVLTVRLMAQGGSTESATARYESLSKAMENGLLFLEKTQRRQDNTDLTFKGEWPTFMCLQRPFFLLGKKKKVHDSNCFSVASTHNALAQVYLLYPEYKSIPPMLELSFKKVLTYRNEDQFNFWNLLEPYRDLKKGAVLGQQPLVRRPTHYKLRSRYINNAANVTEDADDTGLAYTGMALRKQISGREEALELTNISIDNVSGIFNKYLDKRRDNRHWYNYLNGNDHETGAFLTWLNDEYHFKRWNIIKVIGHNATFFLPFSECYPHPYVPYIPYGSNDLDGVVNANVLSTLALNGELSSEGVEDAIAYLNKKSEREKYDRVGLYYPNRYHFPYAVSEAYSNGIKELEPSAAVMTSFLLENQNSDGSWSSRRRVNKKDELQSTVYALNALINFGSFEKRSTTNAIEKALDYIMEQGIESEHGLYWPGGVFFSGGTVIRNTLVWKSDAYTTAIILKAFANYMKHLESKYPILASDKI